MPRATRCWLEAENGMLTYEASQYCAVLKLTTLDVQAFHDPMKMIRWSGRTPSPHLMRRVPIGLPDIGRSLSGMLHPRRFSQASAREVLALSPHQSLWARLLPFCSRGRRICHPAGILLWSVPYGICTTARLPVHICLIEAIPLWLTNVHNEF